MKTIEPIQTISLRASLIRMDAGEVLGIPFGVRSYSYVRHISAIVGNELNREYSVHANREASQYEITRKS